MAYDFLGLVNDVNHRLNEVALTSSNFAAASGYYSIAKDAVNSAIRHIQQEEFEWPWNHVQSELVLAAGSMKYYYPTDESLRSNVYVVPLTSCSVGLFIPFKTNMLTPPTFATVTVKVVVLSTVVMVLPIPLPCTVQ